MIIINPYNIQGEYLNKEIDSSKYSKDYEYFSNWWYLHGELQDEIGYDKATIIDTDEEILYKIYLDKRNNLLYKEYYFRNGIYNVKVLGFEDRPVKGFFWTEFKTFSNIKGEIPIMHGLVVFNDDKENFEYAKEKFKERSKFL